MPTRKGEWSGTKNPNWNGGMCITDQGYILVRNKTHPNADTRGYVREHILVMSEHLGRAINSSMEVVHHINGIKYDNRLENLVLTTKSAHTSHHVKGVRDPRRMVGLKKRIAPHEYVCEQCGVAFTRKRKRKKKHKRIFCSNLCYSRALIGKPGTRLGRKNRAVIPSPCM